MDPYSSFRDEHDIYFYGCHHYILKYQHQGTNLAGYTSVYWRVGRHRSHVAERLCFTGFLLAPYSGWGSFWNGIRGGFGPGFLGNVWDAKKLRRELIRYFKNEKNSPSMNNRIITPNQ